MTGVGFEPTQALVYQISRLRIFLTLAPQTARPSCLAYFDFFLYDMWFFNWVEFALRRCNLLNGLCHPFQKICVSTHAYLRVSKVSAGYPPFWAPINRSAVGHGWRCDFFCFFLLWTVILNWCSSMREFVSWRLCLIVFKTFSDRRGIRTHAHLRVPDFSTEEFLESGALDRSAILPGLRRHFLYDLWFFNWVEFVFQRYNLLNCLCHPFVKVCV